MWAINVLMEKLRRPEMASALFCDDHTVLKVNLFMINKARNSESSLHIHAPWNDKPRFCRSLVYGTENDRSYLKNNKWSDNSTGSTPGVVRREIFFFFFFDLRPFYTRRTQSMKIDHRKTNRSIDINRYQLVNWYWLVLVNRWSIDSHKTVR